MIAHRKPFVKNFFRFFEVFSRPPGRLPVRKCLSSGRALIIAYDSRFVKGKFKKSPGFFTGGELNASFAPI